MVDSAQPMAYIVLGNTQQSYTPQLFIGQKNGDNTSSFVEPAQTIITKPYKPVDLKTNRFETFNGNGLVACSLEPTCDIKQETVIEITQIPEETPSSTSTHTQPRLFNSARGTASDHHNTVIKLQYPPSSVSDFSNQWTQPKIKTADGDMHNNHVHPPSGYHVVVPPGVQNKRYTVFERYAQQYNEPLETGVDQLNTSLTNIQWLGTMTGDTLVRTNNNRIDQRMFVSQQQIDQVSRECGRSKRPPFSYMTMIQMAINSKPNKRMTLREIYSWIENKFPYYRFTAKQGWKNSIRHNLSLYDIFVRERVSTPGLVGSYWTLCNDAPAKKLAVQPPAGSTIAPMPGGSVMTSLPTASQINSSLGIIHASSNDWTLFPIQPLHMMPAVPTQITEKPLPSSLRRTSDQRTPGGSKKHVKIAPRVSVCDGSQLITQAWLNASLGTSNMSDLLSLSGLSTGLSMSAVDSPRGLSTGLSLKAVDSPHCDSGIDSQMSEKSSSDTSAAHLVPASIRGRKRRRKAVNKVRRDSIENKPTTEDTVSLSNVVNISDSFLAGLENGFSSPIRQLLQTPPKFADLRATSTPYRAKNVSPRFSSPLRGLSPLKNLQESNMLTPRREPLGLLPLTPDQQKAPMTLLGHLDMHNLTPLGPSGNTSFGNHSFSRLFADIPLEDIEDNGALDLGNLSWPQVPML